MKELGYSVDWKVLNTRDYGIPQNRERVYIVGTMNGTYTWPAKCIMNPVLNYVDHGDVSISKTHKTKVANSGHYIPENSAFVDLGFINIRDYPYADKYTPCLCAAGSLFSVKYNRLANVKEHLMLQGFPTSFKQVVSDTQMKKQIGNSMSVNVLKQLIGNLI